MAKIGVLETEVKMRRVQKKRLPGKAFSLSLLKSFSS